MISFEKMTQLAIEAFQNAFNEATYRGNPEITEAHLFLGILESGDNLFKDFLKAKGIDENFLKSRVEEIIEKYPKVSGQTQPVPSAGLQKIYAYADKEAKKLGDSFVAIEHLLYGFVETENTLKDFLKSAGVNKNSLKEYYTNARNGEKIETPDSDKNLKVLENFTVDLTKLAYEKKLDPVIGREESFTKWKFAFFYNDKQVYIRRSCNFSFSS